MSSRQNKKKGTGDIGKLLACVGEYKKAALLSPLCMVGEVSMEILIPFLMSKIIDVGIANGNLPYVAKVGLLMILMAILPLWPVPVLPKIFAKNFLTKSRTFLLPMWTVFPPRRWLPA